MNLFEPLNHEPAYRKVAAAIERKIVERALRAGDALPAETALAEQFGVNRSTVREALRELETHGLVGRQARRQEALRHAAEARARVVRGQPRAGPARRDVSRAVGSDDGRSNRPRRVTRPTAAPTTELKAIDRLVSAVAASRDGRTAVPLVVEFFAVIARASHNPVLVTAQDPLNRLLAPTLSRMIDKVPQARARITSAQRRIASAIRDQHAAEARGLDGKAHPRFQARLRARRHRTRVSRSAHVTRRQARVNAGWKASPAGGAPPRNPARR